MDVVAHIILVGSIIALLYYSPSFLISLSSSFPTFPSFLPPSLSLFLHHAQLPNNKASGDTSKSGGGMARGNFDAQLPQDNTFVANFLSGSTCILGVSTRTRSYYACNMIL